MFAQMRGRVANAIKAAVKSNAATQFSKGASPAGIIKAIIEARKTQPQSTAQIGFRKRPSPYIAPTYAPSTAQPPKQTTKKPTFKYRP